MTIENLYRVGAISQFEYENQLQKERDQRVDRDADNDNEEEVEPFADVFERHMARYR